MKVLVTGSRSWTDESVIYDRIIALPEGTTLLHGCARGVDQIAAEAAMSQCLRVTGYAANWREHGRRAGILRNLAMLDAQPDLVIAFWDGESRGTAHTVGEARRRGIPVEVIAAKDDA